MSDIMMMAEHPLGPVACRNGWVGFIPAHSFNVPWDQDLERSEDGVKCSSYASLLFLNSYCGLPGDEGAADCVKSGFLF